MTWTLPDIPESDDTLLVRQLVAIIRAQQERLQQLEDEIARLKGLKTRPVIAPSRLETPPRKPSDPGRKRPGSDKRSKTAQLTITEEKVVPLVDKPPRSIAAAEKCGGYGEDEKCRQIFVPVMFSWSSQVGWSTAAE